MTTPSTEGPHTPAQPVSLWQLRNFRLLWAGMCVSTLGSHTAGIVYPLLVLALTASPETVGWVTALRTTPFVLLCLPVGAMVDRWDRRRVMLTCDIGRALTVGSLPFAMLWGEATLVQIMAVAVVEGTLMVFYNLAEVAALPRVVPISQLPQASGINQAGAYTASIAGPALGTMLFQLSHLLPFATNALSYAFSVLTLSQLRGDFSAAPASGPRNLRAEIKAGLVWLWAEKIVRQMALLTGGLNFVQAAVPLLLIVTAKHLGASVAEIGLIFSAGGVGGVLGALVGGHLQRRFSFGRVITGTLVLQALLFPLYAISPSALWLGAVFAAIQFLGPIYNVVQFSHRIALIPHGLEGRVNAGFRFLAHCLNPIGAALCGVMIERAGTATTLAAFAIVYAVLALAALASSTIRHTPRVTGH